MPTLRSDNRAEAVLRTGEFSDNRLKYFWDPNFVTGLAWQEILGLGSVAWDVYFVYESTANWQNKPGPPSYYMHQLGGLPGDLRLDAEELRMTIRTMLDM